MDGVRQEWGRKEIPFGNAAVIALYKRALIRNKEAGAPIRDELKRRGEELIRKYNLSEEEIQRIYDEFCNPNFRRLINDV